MTTATNVIPLFTFNGQRLRGMKIDGEPRFVAADACRCLGLTNTSITRQRGALDDDEKGVETFHIPGGPQKMAIVSRPGLFKLIARSSKPEAKAFDRWVRHEVLPQIMDNGGYVMADADVQKVAEAALSRANRATHAP